MTVAAGANARIKTFTRNTKGVDYALGDIHGCYRHLEKRLEKVGFNKDCDRLFTAGDLVDRGPENEWVLDWLGQPFFEVSPGNHELFIQKLYRDGDPSDEVLRKCYEFEKSGFEWWGNTSKFFRREFLSRIRDLPAAMQIDTSIGQVGMIHADVPVGYAWQDLPELLSLEHDDPLRKKLFSSRDRHNDQDQTPVAGIERVYVGHNVVRKVQRLGNIVNLDTGAYKGRGQRWPGEGGLSIVRIDIGWEELQSAIEKSKPGKGLVSPDCVLHSSHFACLMLQVTHACCVEKRIHMFMIFVCGGY